MSTIGFGDFVALQNQTTAALQTQPGYVTFCIVYIVCGLTVFAAALNQMVLKLLMLNTEDERKDQIEAKEQARHAPKIDGDILIANDESVERESSFTTNVDNNTLHPKIFANQAAQNFSLLAYNIQNNVISSQSHSTLKSPKITKPRCAKKKFNLSKLRYSATRRPCSSVRHLLTMQDPNGDLPIIYRNPNLNSTHIPSGPSNMATQNGGHSLSSPLPSIVCIPPPCEPGVSEIQYNEFDKLILPSPKRFSC